MVVTRNSTLKSKKPNYESQRRKTRTTPKKSQTKTPKRNERKAKEKDVDFAGEAAGEGTQGKEREGESDLSVSGNSQPTPCPLLFTAVKERNEEEGSNDEGEKSCNEENTVVISREMTWEQDLEAQIAELQEQLRASRATTPAPSQSRIQLRMWKGRLTNSIVRIQFSQ